MSNGETRLKTVTLTADFPYLTDGEAIAIELCRKALAGYIPNPADQRRVLDYLSARAMSEMHANPLGALAGPMAQSAVNLAEGGH